MKSKKLRVLSAILAAVAVTATAVTATAVPQAPVLAASKKAAKKASKKAVKKVSKKAAKKVSKKAAKKVSKKAAKTLDLTSEDKPIKPNSATYMLKNDPTTVEKVDDTHYKGNLGSGITYKLTVTGKNKVNLDIYGKGRVMYGDCDWLTSKGTVESNFNKWYWDQNYTTNKLTFHNGITEIGDGTETTFGYASSLVLPNSVTKINDYAFDGCPIKSVKWSKKLKTIGKYAFLDHKLKSVNIPDSVKSIGEWAFNTSSKKPKTITVGKNCTKIGEAAFGNASDEPEHTYNKITIKCKKEVDCDGMLDGSGIMCIKKFVLYCKPSAYIWVSGMLDSYGPVSRNERSSTKIYVPKKNYKGWKKVALKAAKISEKGEEPVFVKMKYRDYCYCWKDMKTF